MSSGVAAPICWRKMRSVPSRSETYKTDFPSLVQSEALQLANFARPRVHLRHENGRSDVRANEHCVLSVGRHINDGFPVRAAGEAHGRSPAPSGPRVYFQRPHVGLALVGRLLGTREKKPIVARPDQAVLQAVVVED